MFLPSQFNLIVLLANLVKQLSNVGSDEIDGSLGIQSRDQALLAIKVQQGIGVRVIGSQSVSNGLLLVVRSLHQWLTGDIVLHVDLWRLKVLVVHATTGLMDVSTRDSSHNGLVLHVQRNHTVQGLTPLFQHALQRLGLWHRSGITVDNVTVLAVLRVQVVSDDTGDNVIADQLTGIHLGLGSLAHLRTGLDGSSQNVTSGQVANTVELAQLLSLSALTGARSTKEQELVSVVVWMLLSC